MTKLHVRPDWKSNRGQTIRAVLDFEDLIVSKAFAGNFFLSNQPESDVQGVQDSCGSLMFSEGLLL